MKPDPSTVLDGVSAMLIVDVIPNIATSYGQQAVAGCATLLAAAREEIDRGVARRVDENRALRRLFEEARPAVADLELAAALADAAESQDASLLVTDLDLANRALRALLLRLHVYVEERPDEAARRVEAAIWKELRASTERRRSVLGNF
jgi:hypothetical protein